MIGIVTLLAVTGRGSPCRLLHEVGFGGGGGSGRQGEGDVGLLAGPLEDVEDEAVGVFGFLDGGEDYVLRFDGEIGVLGGQAAGVGFDLDGLQLVVVVVALALGERLLPGSGVRIELRS